LATAVAAGGIGAAAGGGGETVAVLGAAVAAAGFSGCAGGVMALTAWRQAAESLAEFCCRQFSAGAPPRGTPEQLARKSLRQLC
jgi:hypothetical protein